MILGQSIERLFHKIPLQLLEVWGSFGYIIGVILMVFAYAGFTFRTGERWRIGREWQAWDGKAFVSMGVSFVAIWVSGFLGSFFVLVPGAQTFESLKDLAVFLSLIFFGYPALLVAPFAYGLSDFYEGIPLEFMGDWWLGYLINPACFWVALQLIGKCPDFKKLKTWRLYVTFVLFFMTIEPFLWGYICSGKFSLEEAYHVITPALFFTTLITWCAAPVATLLLYPVVKKMNLFWADIPGHVKQKYLRGKEWIWESGERENRNIDCITDSEAGIPIRFFILAPFIVTSLFIMGTTSYFALRSSEKAATKYAERFHREISEIMNLKLSLYRQNNLPLEKILENPSASAFIVSRDGRLISSSGESRDGAIMKKAIEVLRRRFPEDLTKPDFHLEYKVNLQSARKLTKETWDIHAVPVAGEKGLILLTAMPEHYYLSGVLEGQNRSSLVFAFGLVLVLFIVGVLGAMVITPIRRVCHAAHALSKGDLNLRIPESRLAEMNTLSIAFNTMADSLRKSFQDLSDSENRINLAVQSGDLGVWEWDIEKGSIIWNDRMFQQYDTKPGSVHTYSDWLALLHPEDVAKFSAHMQSALLGEKEFHHEFRVRWKDGTIHILRSHSKTLRNADTHPTKMFGMSYDITERRMTEKELQFYRNQLEEVVDKRTKALMKASDELHVLTEKQSRAEVFEKIAQIFLSLRDYANSPLQSQNIAIALLKKRCPEQNEIIASLEDSVQRLSNINRIFKRLESNFSGEKLLTEHEILEYLDKMEL